MDLLKAEVERKRKLVEEKELLAVRGRAYLAGWLLWGGPAPSRRRKFGLFRARNVNKGGKTVLKKQNKNLPGFFGGAWSLSYLAGLLLLEVALGGPLEEEIRIN